MHYNFTVGMEVVATGAEMGEEVAGEEATEIEIVGVIPEAMVDALIMEEVEGEVAMTAIDHEMATER